MLVNSTPDGWQIIYQQAHALLAAQLAWHWPTLLPPDRWVGLLAATAQHDDEQAAWHGHGGHHGLTPAGAPANFTQLPFSLEQAAGVLDAARFQGRWRSLLTGLHLECLYRAEPAAAKFVASLRPQLRQWQRALKITAKEAQAAYHLLHWCDRLSLILCRHELPEMARELEIHPHPQQPRIRHFVSQPQGPGTAVVVRPWPFSTPKFEATVEARTLTKLQFADDAALAAALREAPIETLRWTLRG